MKTGTDLVLPALSRAHFNAVQTQLNQEGIGDLGSPRLLLTLMDWHSRGEMPSQKELADQLHVSPATVATSLKSLERNGYVERRADSTDSRRNLVTVTEKALDALEQSKRIFRRVDEAMFAGFSPEEVECLLGYHRRMLENLYAMGGDRDAPCVPPPPPPYERKDEYK